MTNRSQGASFLLLLQPWGRLNSNLDRFGVWAFHPKEIESRASWPYFPSLPSWEALKFLGAGTSMGVLWELSKMLLSKTSMKSMTLGDLGDLGDFEVTWPTCERECVRAPRLHICDSMVIR